MTARKPWVRPEVVTRSTAISVEKRERIVDLASQGLSVAVIAERLGLHRNTVSHWRIRMGLVERRSCARCKRTIRGPDARCYVCRGYRERLR
jgi:IS30 family transposase